MSNPLLLAGEGAGPYNPPMSTPRERIQDDIKTAMKAKQPEQVATLRLLLTAIMNEQIGQGATVDEEGFMALVRRAIKQRQEAATQFTKGERPELAEKELREAEILGVYLPAQVSEGEVRAAIEELVAAEGLAGPKAMGVVMKAMIAKFGATADGATLSRLARKILLS
jgi:uncharacterized protein YqeY